MSVSCQCTRDFWWFFNIVGDSRCPISDTWWQTETGGFMSSVLHSQPKSTVGTPACIAPEVLLRQECDGKELPKGKWFCCMDCNRVHSALQNLVVSGEQKLQDSLLSIIKKKLEEKGSESSADVDVKWRLLSGQMASGDTRLLLSKAVSIFHGW